ncbi:hypothetical protein [Cellulomonas dongxiuzhuiae]|uniref:hypothetical protein n=1 Tax=Cellulomonas dongxiuzhuiae TaxID=2819979 RepID=UPI001FBBCA60|nr:hypothetical protein [Cellulomonas dongxiuzhuiae]
MNTGIRAARIGAFCGGFLAAVADIVGSIVDPVPGPGAGFTPMRWVVLAAAGAVIGLVGGAAWDARKRAKLRERQERARQAAEAQRARDTETRAREAGARTRGAATDAARRAVVDRTQEAVRVFSYLPSNLRYATSQVERARAHRAAGAYSPFWTAIESASVHLGEYNVNVRRLVTLAEMYPDLAAAYRSLDPGAQVPDFPVSVSAAKATDAAEPVAAALRVLAYDAQRDPVYAQIWEQRRTTAAVVDGFRSMEAAVDRLARTVESSAALLASQVGELVAATSVGSLSVSSAVRDAATAAQAAAQVQESRGAQVQDALETAVEHLDVQRRRALGWR